MTAEVAIMNTQGIALAADSAVTLGVGKTYNTADKLFALSKYHPVGIMMYSSALLMGIDCEVIIKSYRDFLGTKSFDTLSEYAGDFINYLSKFPYWSEEQMRICFQGICFSTFRHVLNWFLGDLRKEFEGKENIEKSQIDTVFNNTLKSIRGRMKNVDDEKQLKVDFDYIDDNLKIANDMLGVVFEKYKLSKKQITDIVEILKLDLQKCGWNDNFTGIVIAGYGEREIFPSVHEFCVKGKIGKSLIYFNEEIASIDGINSDARICPYAQTEMVHQFAKGIDPDFYDVIIDKVDTAIQALAPLLGDTDKPKLEKLSALIAETIKDTSVYVYQDPILATVACMQKSELVAMAESMVNLTALKRHVSTDEETVGGPIDVALITKGDGFVWIKKKTTYDPQLNRGLNQNYFRGGRDGGL